MTATVIPLRERIALEFEAGSVLALAADVVSYFFVCAFWGVVKGTAVTLALCSAWWS